MADYSGKDLQYKDYKSGSTKDMDNVRPLASGGIIKAGTIQATTVYVPEKVTKTIEYSFNSRTSGIHIFPSVTLGELREFFARLDSEEVPDEASVFLSTEGIKVSHRV